MRPNTWPHPQLHLGVLAQVLDMKQSISSCTDSELMLRSISDGAAFEEIFVRHSQDLYDWFLARTGSTSVSLDLTSETFAQGWQYRSRFQRRSDSSAFPWLLGIGRNQYRIWARRRRVETRARARLDLLEQREASDPADTIVDVPPSLDQLPNDQRVAVELRVIHGMSYQEVAQQIGCSQPAARMRVMRGLRSITST